MTEVTKALLAKTAKFAKDYLIILENREWADTDQGGAVTNPKSRNAIRLTPISFAGMSAQ